MNRHVVADARTSLAGLPLVRAPAVSRRVTCARAMRRDGSRARRPDGSPSEVTKFRRNERGSPAGQARVPSRAVSCSRVTDSSRERVQ